MDCKIIALTAVCAFFNFFKVANSNEPVVPLSFQRELEAHYGLGWPYRINVVAGHDALLKLSRSVADQQSCTVTTPLGQSFDVNNPPNSRFERWGNGCCIRIRRVYRTDEGRWRLTSTHANSTITGFSEVHVLNATSTHPSETIALEDGSTNSYVTLSSLGNQYCMVAQPFAQRSLVAGQCMVMLERISRAVQGTWDVRLGLPGQVAELHVERRVAVEAEHLDVGFEHDTQNNKLNLYCNILHTSKNIIFCRFQRTSESFGYNLVDGLSDGSHSYYGNGFLAKHCGITIENPTTQDFSTWRCSVGVDQDEQMSSMQALISVPAQTISLSTVRTEFHSPADGERTIFVQKNNVLTINCQASDSLSYCWFQHPDGTQYTPGEKSKTDPEQSYWYSGENLQMGDCSISFAKTTEHETGLWTCHMGSSKTPGIEITESFQVRVTGSLAANELEVTGYSRESVTLYCHTSGGRKSLEYCRFLSPQNIGININSRVTSNHAILGRFSFTTNHSLDYGDCSLTINPVYEEDEGDWTCAAVIVDEIVESRDAIRLIVLDRPNRKTEAIIIGVVTSVVGLLALLGIYVMYRRKMFCFARLNQPNDLPMNNVNPQRSVSLASSGSEDSNNSGAAVVNVDNNPGSNQFRI